MRYPWIKRGLWAGVVVIVAAGFWQALRPKPVAVDIAEVAVRPMAVTITEDGATRVKEIFRISSPVTGRVDRTLLEVGDPVTSGETVVARIHPVEPPFMDERTLAEALARVEAGEAAITLAEAELARAEAALGLSASDYARAQQLAQSNTIPQTRLETARIDVELNKALVDSAKAQILLRKSELSSAQARLIQPGGDSQRDHVGECCVALYTPIDGVVLSLSVESENVVAAGAPLAEIGDPRDLEVVVDLLSSDAVQIKPGAKAVLTGWGGQDLNAVVRRVDPAGFVKLSALGIEERRVNAILDLTEVVPDLGHGFQLRVALIVWQSDAVLSLPVTALFRDGNEWATFVIAEGRADLRHVKIGQMNGSLAEVLSGIEEGTQVVDFPGDKIQPGTEVFDRNSAL